jgi:TM2 domain-containing membrane protein YozV
LACFLSLYITGLGQVYNKQVLKGSVLFGVTVFSFGAAEIYHSNNIAHPHDAVTAGLLLPFFAAYIYSAIDAPVTASYLNRTYHLGKKKKEFTSLQFSPNVINTGAGNKLTAGVSLVLR